MPKATLDYYLSGTQEIHAFLFEDVLTAIAGQAAGVIVIANVLSNVLPPPSVTRTVTE